MKINIVGDINNCIGGYTNLVLGMNGVPSPGITAFPISTLIDVNNHCDDGECDVVRVYNLIDAIPPQAFGAVMDTYLKKVAVGGEFICESVDFYSVCKLVNRGELTTEQANSILRPPSSAFNYDLDILSSYLDSRGLKPIKKYVKGTSFVLQYQRQS